MLRFDIFFLLDQPMNLPAYGDIPCRCSGGFIPPFFPSLRNELSHAKLKNRG